MFSDLFIIFYRNCPANYTCIEGLGANPGKGYVSYDSFPAAMLTSLQVCTLDYWEIVFNSVSESIYFQNIRRHTLLTIKFVRTKIYDIKITFKCFLIYNN